MAEGVIRFIENDGGRAEAGFKGRTGDCGVRAIAIACQLPYPEALAIVERHAGRERVSARRAQKSHAKQRSSVRGGIYVQTMHRVMDELGWRWTPCMTVGSGCKVHLRADELPAGRVIVRLSRHYAAVIDGVLHDTYDDSRSGTRCVYGYWSPA